MKVALNAYLVEVEALDGPPPFHSLVVATSPQRAVALLDEEAVLYFQPSELEEISPGYLWCAGDGSSVMLTVRFLHPWG